MGNTLACFEVTSDSIRLVLGYEEDRAPVLLYKSEMAIPDIISGGVVKEEDALVAALSKFHKIVDDHVKLDLTITTVNVVLPSIGFLAFRGAKTTNTVSPSVTAVDVSNVISLLQKEAVKDGYSVIDIIPQEFILDDGRRFYEPPIGETSLDPDGERLRARAAERGRERLPNLLPESRLPHRARRRVEPIAKGSPSSARRICRRTRSS